MPELSTEAVRFTDVEQIGATLRDMATAGAVLEPDDPIIGEVRDLMGVSRPDEATGSLQEEDAALVGNQTEDVDGIPETDAA